MALLCLAGSSAGPQARCGDHRSCAGDGDRTKSWRSGASSLVRFRSSACDRIARRSTPDQSPSAPTDFPAPTKAAPSGATDPAVDLRAVVERVMITRTTIEIELGEAIAGEDQDRMIRWTPPSPY